MTARAAESSTAPGISFFERWLTLWVALCIIVGVLLGQQFPSLFKMLGRMEIARVNLPVGALIWMMIVPMLLVVKVVNASKDWYEGGGPRPRPSR